MTTDPAQSLTPILLRFPGKSAAIKRLVLRDDEFRCLVQDYLLAFTTLRRLNVLPSSSPADIDDYARVLRELEDEVARFLTRSRAPEG